MRVSSHARLARARLATALVVVIAFCGCTRDKYRIQADHEAYSVIAERNADPRWCAHQHSIEIDPRSRYFDAYDPDNSPMPPDDPASHAYMHVVAGKKGWKHWHRNGDRIELENPVWQAALAEYLEFTEDGVAKIDVDSAVQLAYVHSPSHQSQLETLYLSALDVTAERFRLDTQFFGGYDSVYNHNGSLIPPALRFIPGLRRWEVNPPIDGVENNRLTVGRPTVLDPALVAERRFATAGELLVGFANSFVFEFTGGDGNLAASIANFSLTQPLLRGAGRDVALEQLTFVERNLLANLRAYGQFRQGFYTNVAIGELGVTGTRRGGAGTSLMSFSGQPGLGGYLGLMQQTQQIRNSEDNLSLRLRTLALLQAFRAVDVISQLQVEQFKQSVERERSNLLEIRVNYELALDRFKANTLGLPPDLQIELDETLIRQFQLVDRDAISIQDSIVALQQRIGETPATPSVELMSQMLSEAFPLVEPIERHLDEVQNDLTRMDEVLPTREPMMSEDEKEQLKTDRGLLIKSLADREQEFIKAVTELERVRAELSDKTTQASRRAMIVWIKDVMRLVERTVLIQARARLERITVPTIALESRDAYQIALANRLDFMNGRAALVDSWRLIQFNADALQTVVDVTARGDIRTARNNPVSFRSPTANARLGLEVDAPFTRLLERNAYRESLIQYQRNRRNFIQSRDSLQLGLRALLRQLDQLRTNLEIQRRALVIAIRLVDLTQADLAAPVPPAQPGQRAAQFNSITAINLINAQNSLRDSQNSFLTVWLNYYATRLRLSRELGIMVIDHDGRWIEYPLPGSESVDPVEDAVPMFEELPLPPVVSIDWSDFAGFSQDASGSAGSTVAAASYSTPVPHRLRRLPTTRTDLLTNGYNPASDHDRAAIRLLPAHPNDG